MDDTPRFLEQGSGPRTLVFLHGISGAAAGWREPMTRFAAHGWRCLAWDMPGYGASPAVTEFRFPDLARLLGHMLDRVGIGEVTLVGHSMGGMVALEASVQWPERVRALVLAATSPAFAGNDEAFRQRFLAQRLGPLDQGLTMAQLAARVLPASAGPGADPAGMALAADIMAAIPVPAYRAAMRCLTHFDRRPALPRLPMPTLCLAGEHDQTAPPALMRRMAAHIPHARYTELPATGHLMHFEQPDAFCEAVGAFVEVST